jgi:uncharacterized membrane protein YhaH (DUF805 family)
MGPLAKFFLGGFGVYCLATLWLIDSDLSDKACINENIRLYVKLLFILCTLIPAAILTIHLHCEQDCYNRCASFEAKEKKQKSDYWGSASTVILAIINLVILVLMSLILNEINTDSNCNVSPLTYNLIYGVIGVSSAIIFGSLFIAYINIGIKSKKDAEIASRKGVL